MEGEIITKLEKAMGEGEDYNMKEYLGQAQQIAEQKLQMYAELVAKIKEFRSSHGD